MRVGLSTGASPDKSMTYESCIADLWYHMASFFGGFMTYCAERFWQKVGKDIPDRCWPWMGRIESGKRAMGYGRLDYQGVIGCYAHRVAYYLARPGRIEIKAGIGEQVLHRCDNPLCCNPRHLFLGDHARNMRDKARRGRAPHYRSTESPRAKLTAEDVFWMRMQKKYGATKKALAMLYEVSETTVSGACYGRHYQDVT